MSAGELRQKSQHRQKRARFEAFYSIILGLVMSVLFARTFARVHEMIPRLGWGLLSLWGIYFAYQAYRWMWPGTLAPDAALNTTLRSYLSELEKQRDYARHIWNRAGLPFCFLGIAMIIVPTFIKSVDTSRLLLNWAPVFALLALWLAVFFPVRKRRRQKLQREIEELRILQGDSRS